MGGPVKILASLLLVAALCVPQVFALDVKVHIFDVGGAKCTLTRLPGNKWMVFDSGVGSKINDSALCGRRIDETMPDGVDIDLLILCHSDSDHVNSVAELLNRRNVTRVVRTGHERDTVSWCTADYAIKVHIDGAEELSEDDFASNLAHSG